MSPTTQKQTKQMLRIIQQRLGLVLDHCFWGHLAMRLELLEDVSIETACVNGKRIKYNPRFIESLDDDRVQFVLAHEVMHCAMGTHLRRNGRDTYLWNMATDYAINPILSDAGFKLIEGCLYDSMYRGMTAEEIYSDLERKQQEEQEQKEQEQEEQESSDESQSGSGQDNGEPEEQEDEEEQEEGDGEPEDEDEDQDEQDGDSDSGMCDDDTNTCPDPGGCGGVEDADILDESDLKEQLAQWQQAVTMAYKAAQKKGQAFPSLDRAVEEIQNPPLPWYVILRDFVETNARNDYMWEVPDRNYLQRGLYVPGICSDELPEIVIAVDTSGSIDEIQLAIFLKEVSQILSAYDTTVQLIYCDDQITNEETYRTSDLPIKPNPKQIYGGTDFRPVFERVQKRGLTPACLIYFTDTYGTFPEREPSYPVLWVTKTKDRKLPFGKTVMFDANNTSILAA